MTAARADGALPRHTLVWPAAAAFERLIERAGDCDARDALREWRDAAHPFVVRRVDPGSPTPAAAVAIGLPLPPARGKRRIAATIARADIACARAPLSVAEIAAALPAGWRGPLARLDRDARALGVALRGFGSIAWQAITGLPYLHAGSDVDVTFAPATPAQLEATVALFERWERAAGRRIDAEIVFDGDCAVAWREWRRAAPGDRVLAKSPRGARLVARALLRVRGTAAAVG